MTNKEIELVNVTKNHHEAIQVLIDSLNKAFERIERLEKYLYE